MGVADCPGVAAYPASRVNFGRIAHLEMRRAPPSAIIYPGSTKGSDNRGRRRSDVQTRDSVPPAGTFSWSRSPLGRSWY